MDARLVQAIQKNDTAAQRIYAAKLCGEEAARLLTDFILCYEEGLIPEKLNTIYGDAVELMSLWRNNSAAIREDLASQ